MAGKLNLDKLKERLNELNTNNNNGGGSFGYVNLKDGRNVVRILPPKENGEFVQEVFLHYGVGKSESNKKGTVVVCPTTHGDDKACPICEAVKELRNLSKAKDDTYSKQASQLGRKKRVYFNAIDRSLDLESFTKNSDGKYLDAEGKESNPVQILAVGTTVYKAILGIMCDPEYGDITDAQEGLDVIITKSGTGMNTEYDVKTVRREGPIGFADWESNLNDLTSLAKTKKYDEIAGILTGETTPEGDSDSSTGASAGETNTSTEAGGSEDSGEDMEAEIQAALRRRRGK